MEKDNTFLYLVLFVVLGIILFPILTQIKLGFFNFYNSAVNFTQTYTFYLILLIIFILLICLGIYIAYIKIRNRNREGKEREQNVGKLKEDILNCIDANLSGYNSEKIYEFIIRLREIRDNAMRYEELQYLEDEIQIKLLHARQMYGVALKDERNDRAEIRKNKIKEETEQAKQEKYRESLAKDEMDRDIYRKLNVEDTNVFIISRLKVEERNSLLRQGFNQSNQYFPDKAKNIPVLVKKIMNHSDEHTFLVWYVKKLLKTFKGIINIEDHETKIADITFKYKNRNYAIEVETGSLARHKKRLEGKINYLNSKYKNRWFFIVSNKNLLTSYKRFGPATRRSEVTKMIEKTIKIDYPDFSGGKEQLPYIKY